MVYSVRGLITSSEEVLGNAFFDHALVPCSFQGGLTDDPNWNQRFGYPSRLVMLSPFYTSQQHVNIRLTMQFQCAIRSTIVAVYQLGCLFGCFLTYLYGEALGRKMTIRVGAVIMTGGALLQIIALSRECLIVGRILSGIGLGRAFRY
jgi:MFS family permease